jgi:PAS domain S-box-containing protein
MKLLYRFVWLIIGISIIVFTGISIVHFRAENEFKLIKNSISKEYDVLIDKMLSPERSEINQTYNEEVGSSGSTYTFISQPIPIPEIVSFEIDTMVMSHFNVDAIWFYKNDASLFYFYSHRGVEKNLLSISQEEISNIFEGGYGKDFYLSGSNKLYRIFSSTIGDKTNPKGFIFSATQLDSRWVNYYQIEINNSEISFKNKDEILSPVSKKDIRIERPLLSFDGSITHKMIIDLKLPFLALWQNTTSSDNWLMSGAMILTVILLILALLLWVISPLNKISKSLEKGNSTDIQPLINNSSELGKVARMISDYHLKNEEIEASENTKRHIIEQVQVGIIITDASSNLIVTANPYACELIDAPEDAVLGNVSQNFFSPLSDEQKERLKTTTENISGFESLLFNSKGEKIPILRNVTRMFMDGKHAIMETFINLSEIKNLQGKLEEEKKKLSLAVKNSGLVFCEYDFITDEISLSDEWKFLLTGKSEKSAENVINNIYQSDLKVITDQFDSLENGIKDTLTAEFRVVHPERGIIWLSASVLIAKRNEIHKPKQLIGLIEDITERINIQQELIKAKEKAEESDRMKSAYLGNMSHKIRTPLNAIVGFSNLLTEEDITPNEKNNYVNIIRHDTEQVLHLIDDIINIAKIDANKMDVNNRPCNINKLITELSDYYKTNEKTNKIDFSIKTMLPDGKDVLFTDQDKLYQIMSNILNNSFKFTDKGIIELGYFINPVEQKVIFYVKDSGIGIHVDNKEKVFNRYFQADQTTEGTGLGLSISQSLVKLLGGKIHFDSMLGEGSTFFVELPIKES